MSQTSVTYAKPAAETIISVNGRLQADPKEAVLAPSSHVRWMNDSNQAITIRFRATACPIESVILLGTHEIQQHKHGATHCRFEVAPKKHGESGIVQDEPGEFVYEIMIDNTPPAGAPKIIIQ